MAEHNFWSNNTFEPKRKFRYTVSLGDTDISTYLVKKVDKPAWTSDSTEHKFLNYTFKYPGRVTWDDITLTLVDSDDPHTSAVLYTILRGSGYALPEFQSNTDIDTGLSIDEHLGTTISKAAATAQLGKVKIKQFSGMGGGIIDGPSETWVLHNAFIKDCKFGDLDYESDDLIEISLTLTYDWAVLTGRGTSNF